MPTKVKPDKERPEKPSKNAIAPEDFLSLGDILGRILIEVVQARVRHRALLLTLLKAEVIQWDAYIENYQRISQDDVAPLFSQLVMKPEVFMQKFGEWSKDDVTKYGFAPAGRVRAKPPKNTDD